MWATEYRCSAIHETINGEVTRTMHGEDIPYSDLSLKNAPLMSARYAQLYGPGSKGNGH